MNFNHSFQGPGNISMPADDFIGMRTLQAQLQQEVTRLTGRCGALEHELRTQIQKGRESDSKAFQFERALRAREGDIVELRSQLHQERLRDDAICKAGRPVLNPASIPLRIVSVGDSSTDMAEDLEFSRNDSVNSSEPSEPSRGPVPLLSQYSAEIPEQDREAIRTRMLKDRGPGTLEPASSPQEVEKAAPAPGPGAPVSGPSHDDGETPYLYIC